VKALGVLKLKGNYGIALALILILLSIISSIPFAKALPTKAVSKAFVRQVKASGIGNPYSAYRIGVNTTDGGRIEYLFIWERSIELNWKGFYGKLIVGTSPILHMSKYSKNGSLEMSLTYVPLLLMQYNDSDGNGLFDFWTRKGKSFSDEVEQEDIEWEGLRDKPYRIFPLAPMFQMIFRQQKWEWKVSPLSSRNLTLGDTVYQEFSWNISAKVPSIPWFYSEIDKDDKEHLRRIGLEWTSIEVTLGYHVRLLPHNPEVKYDLDFANTSWADGKNLRLAMISTIIYRGEDPVVVKLGGKGFKVFQKTIISDEPIILISEKAFEASKAFVSYTPWAIVDGRNVTDAIKTAINPAFLLATPIVVPQGLYATGIITELEGRPSRNRIAFAHQVSVPRFNDSLSHDPTIGLVADLATVALPMLPWDTVSIRMLLIGGTLALAALTAYLLSSRMRSRPKPNWGKA
jgi:hypothetical protein